MKTLNLPSYQFTLREDNKKTKIFDAIRKKFLVLTPEEWVRQHIVKFLIEERNFPKGLIALEKGLKVNDLQKRADVLVYAKSGKPILMVECKAADVAIDQKVFDQIGRYNIAFNLPYLLVTNGLLHYCARVDFQKKEFSLLNEIPNYEDLIE